MKASRFPLPALLFFLLSPALAQAHTGVGVTHGFFHGFEHPLFGLDHLLAMVAVGLWAAQMGGRAFWLVPVSFVSVMVLGGWMGVEGIPFPFVETGIAASVLVLGLLIAMSARLPLFFSCALVGLFALFHGHAHGAEMPADASGMLYALGFALATASLHGAGMGLGLLAKRTAPALAIRIAGGAIAVAGLCLFVG